jgi:hypothetical protein
VKVVQDRSKPEPAEVAAAAATVADAVPTQEPQVEELVVEPEKPLPERGEEIAPVVEASPSPTPVIDPTTTPAPSPTTPPDPSPTTPPSPEPLPPAPPWSASFASSVPIGSAQLELISSRVEGSAGHNLVLSQAVGGPLLDEQGEASGRLYVEYFGTTKEATGSLGFWIFLDTDAGRYRYDASAALTGLIPEDDGSTTYVFSGNYLLVESPPSDEDAAEVLVPHDGTVGLTLRFWADGRSIYRTELALEESPAP